MGFETVYPKQPAEQRAADVIVNAVETRIASGELENNKPLPAERDLMEEFGVSRTVIREAISKLASRGLVEARPRFRPIVRKPDYATVLDAAGTIIPYMLNEPDGVFNLYQSRIFIERGLVRDAALYATIEDIADIEDALIANENSIADTQAFFRSDIAFHSILYRIGGNPIFPALHKGYIAWLSPHWAGMASSIAHNETNYRAHRAIYEGIVKRDPQGAENALTKHLQDAWEFVRDTFKNGLNNRSEQQE